MSRFLVEVCTPLFRVATLTLSSPRKATRPDFILITPHLLSPSSNVSRVENCGDLSLRFLTYTTLQRSRDAGLRLPPVLASRFVTVTFRKLARSFMIGHGFSHSFRAMQFYEQGIEYIPSVCFLSVYNFIELVPPR